LTQKGFEYSSGLVSGGGFVFSAVAEGVALATVALAKPDGQANR
jgi:hypothetical protein